jgi:galactokinase
VSDGAGPDFATLFGRPPQAVGRAHGRVNLIGDHTDYNDGFVLPTVIPQVTVVEVARGADRHVAYSATLNRRVEFGRMGALRDFARYVGGCLRVLAADGVDVPPLLIRVASTVPVGAGLSSSAALEVATLLAVNALLALDLSPVQVAILGRRAEIEYAGVQVGIMDQMACALAEPERMLFLDTRSLDYRLLPLPAGAEAVVIDSGEQRALAGSAYNTRREECRRAAEMLHVPSLRDVTDVAGVERLPSPLRERARHVVSENQRVLRATTAEAREFGALMNASHQSLRDDYAVTTPTLDALAAFLREQPEAFGARMTGAGFGGACVALARAGRGAEVAGRAADYGRAKGWRRIVPP